MIESRRHKVLMLLENSTYPMDSRVYRESQALLEAGYDVAVICPATKGERLREQVDGVEVYRFPEPPGGNGLLGYLREYGYAMLATTALSARVLFDRGFDVIHAANPPDSFVFVAAPYKLLGKKFVFDHHDLAPEMYHARFSDGGSRLVHWLLLGLEKLSCKLADHVIATNQSYMAVEMQRGRVPADRISIVRNGPSLEGFRGAEPLPDLMKDSRTIVAFAGVMGYQDGVDYFLRAVRHLVFDLGRSNFLCLLIGGIGDAQDDLKAAVADLKLEQFVRFTGYVTDEDWARYLVSADICVAPDPSNSFTDRSTMVKVMEYMAAGKPIVAFDLPEHRFTAREAAAYARPNDELDFACVIAQLMDDPRRREAMGQFGRHRVETELAWSHSVPNLLRAYSQLLSKPDVSELPSERDRRQATHPMVARHPSGEKKA